MTHRLFLDPALPKDGEPFVRRSRELWTQAAKVTRELQAPPVLHVWLNSNQAITANVQAAVQMASVKYDTHGWWDTSTYKYTPKRAGYYAFSWCLGFEAGASANAGCFATLYANGSAFRSADSINPTTVSQITASSSAIVYADGNASYFQLQALCSQNTNVVGNAVYSYFCAHYIGDDQLR